MIHHSGAYERIDYVFYFLIIKRPPSTYFSDLADITSRIPSDASKDGEQETNPHNDKEINYILNLTVNIILVFMLKRRTNSKNM